MICQITLTYKDDKTVNLLLSPMQVEDLLDCLKKNELFYNPETNVGFWSSMDEIRHIIIHPKVEDEKTEEKEEDE